MEVKAVVCLFWISVQRISSLQEGPESKQDVATDAEMDFERLENEYAVGNVSTGIDIYENITIPEVPGVPTEKTQTSSNNVTEFRPSVHLGEIEEFRSANSNPFNKQSHLKFDNSFAVHQDIGNWHTDLPVNNQTNYFGKKNVNNNINPTHQEPSFFPSPVTNENRYFRVQNSAASFSRGSPSFQSQNVVPTAFQNSLQLLPSWQRPEYPVISPDKTHFETTYAQEIPSPFDRPGVFHDNANFLTPYNEIPNYDYVKPPSFQNYEEPNGVKIQSEIQEVLPTRNQRFPYKFHHESPTFMDSNLEYVGDEQVFHNVPRERRISPWKKIIHLIGTILPFGLLLATLKPNFIQIPNSTQSTIPLLKLKDVNLPPEHKSLRMADDPGICEEKNICEVILAGSKPRSNLLQNVLWNFVIRTPENTAKDNGLRELFQAVKKKDCNLITC